MSTYGTYSLRLERQRQEELRRRREEQRKEGIRRQTTHLIAETRRMNRQFVNPITEHFGRGARQQAEGLVRQAEQLLRSDPDQALKLARRSRATVERGMAEASGRTAKWSEEKAAAQEAVTVFQLALDSVLNGLNAHNDHSRSQLTPIAHQLAAAKAALRRENFEAAKDLVVTGQAPIRQIEQAYHRQQEQEDVRREIVCGLRHVLANMGFAVDRAHLGDNGEKDKVVLAGRLPSGRTARFLIALDEKVEYDFDGYPHHDPVCGKDSEQIRRQLEEHCQVKTSELEVHWKGQNTKRTDKRARSLPIQGRKFA